ncbi:hypothetical protein ABK905_15445 [Acerihabitans sp. KWT182]|uniref:CsbD family protein n=1 Tax=Acerihabitans sp. KWT182 TaxID=3157919 RepID=A0AAU7Q5E1_9GAMM
MMTIAQHFEQKGKLEGKLEVARRSLADGASRGQVKNWTGLSDEDLDRLEVKEEQAG